MTRTPPAPIGSTVLGYPRIGRERQLKRALEDRWAGRIDGAALDRAALAVRLDALYTMSRTGLDTVPVNTFSWYDQMLDTAVLVDAIPDRFTGVTGEHTLAGFDADRYFAMARGAEGIAPLEMTKWFDTNYHYLVAEIGPETTFALNAAKPLTEFEEARSRKITSRPVVVGPYTFLALAKATDEASEGFRPLSRLDDLVEVYADLLAQLALADVDWVQIDEPALVRDLTRGEVEAVYAAYDRLGKVTERPAILLATYFGSPEVDVLSALAHTDVDGFALDLIRGPQPGEVEDLEDLFDKSLVLGAVDGRNIWRTDLRAATERLVAWRGISRTMSVSTSCSLLHVPYDVSVETGLDPALRSNLAFADQKLAEVVALQRSCEAGGDEAGEAFAGSDAAVAARTSIPGLYRGEVAGRISRVTEADREREDPEKRAAAQAERLGLPVLPTTTIGSFPQTGRVRKARADLRTGRIDQAAYVEQMRQEVREVIALQESLGLDVLVHGEPERNDMVQYFAEQLNGYAATQHGWVQSYGSRCVRPPILFGDIERPEPMTVEWATFAQGLTDKPVKGMLTGPVTMLAWSFVRDDQPRSVTADQLALALRDEVTDLEAAGIGIIQVDEPALRELLPLRRGDQAAYLDWAVKSFRLATSGVRAETQIHTHLCYSEFGEIIEAIGGLGADVTSVEAARSNMELLQDIARHGFGAAIGPGVYDIHSPRVPDETEISALIEAALGSLAPEKLWINPDCGLKTRAYAEVEPALRHMVTAASNARGRL